MKTKYDAEADALYIRFTDAAVELSEEVRPGVVIDFDTAGRIVAVEFLDASRRMAPGADLSRATAA